MTSSGRSGSCSKNGMVRMLSTQLENVAIIGRPSPSPTSRARIWSQPAIAPRDGTRVLSACRNQTLPPDTDALGDRRAAVLLERGRVQYAIADRLALLALEDTPAGFLGVKLQANIR